MTRVVTDQLHGSSAQQSRCTGSDAAEQSSLQTETFMGHGDDAMKV